jgi:hypothetical protein
MGAAWCSCQASKLCNHDDDFFLASLAGYDRQQLRSATVMTVALERAIRCVQVGNARRSLALVERGATVARLCCCTSREAGNQHATALCMQLPWAAMCMKWQERTPEDVLAMALDHRLNQRSDVEAVTKHTLCASLGRRNICKATEFLQVVLSSVERRGDARLEAIVSQTFKDTFEQVLDVVLSTSSAGVHWDVYMRAVTRAMIILQTAEAANRDLGVQCTTAVLQRLHKAPVTALSDNLLLVLLEFIGTCGVGTVATLGAQAEILLKFHTFMTEHAALRWLNWSFNSAVYRLQRLVAADVCPQSENNARCFKHIIGLARLYIRMVPRDAFFDANFYFLLVACVVRAARVADVRLGRCLRKLVSECVEAVKGSLSRTMARGMTPYDLIHPLDCTAVFEMLPVGQQVRLARENFYFLPAELPYISWHGVVRAQILRWTVLKFTWLAVCI